VRRLLSQWVRSVRIRANRTDAGSAGRSNWLRYGVAVLVVGMALLVKLLLDPLIAEQSPFLLLSGAVMVGAWFGGLGPGLLATVLGALGADYFFLPPEGSFTGLGAAFLPLFLFMLQGLLISLLAAALRSARQRADSSALEARSHLERLLESEERFRLLVQGVADYAIFMLDPKGRINSWNEGAELMMGYKAEEIIGKHVSRFFTEEDIERGHPEEVLRIAAEEGRYQEEGVRVRKNGSMFWTSVLITALRDEQGNLRGFTKVEYDVTDRKEAEKKLRESEELYRRVVEQAAENIFLVDVETKRIMQANAALHRSLGYSSEELSQLTLYDIVAHDRESVDRNVGRVVERMHHFVGERRYRRKDGTLMDVEVSASVVSHEGGEVLCIVAHDVTERKKAEKERSKLAAIVESSDDAIFSKTLEGIITSWNAGASKLYGYTPEEAIGRPVTMLVPEDRLHEIPQILENIRQGKSVDHFETVRLTKEGRLLDVSLTVSPVKDTRGELVGASTIAHDITERKRVEEALQRSLDAQFALYEAGRQLLSSSLKRQEIGSSLLEIIERISGTKATVINLSDDGKGLYVWRTSGSESFLASVCTEPAARATRQAAFEAAEERLLEMEDPALRERRLAGLFLPLQVHDRVIGVLEVYGSKHLVGSGAVETFASLASQVASALENAQLYEELAEHRHRLQELVGKLVMAQEEERRRVAYEVHDGLAQVAAAAYQHLQNFTTDDPLRSTRGEAELDKALEMLQHTVEEARNVVADLRPTVLDDFGLVTALRLQVERLSSEGLRTSYEESLGEERLPEVVETTLFRVAQEALTNVRRHARTDRAHVALERGAQEVRLEVRDWGLGFVADDVTDGANPSEKVGLASMRERVALLEGHFEIDSEPGVGTVVVAEVPLQEETDTEGAGDNEE
jgi:PAS domain S-box-containing protein